MSLSCHPEVLLRKDVLKICSKFTGEHSCRSAISIETTLRHGCSPVNLLHIFRTPFLKNTSGWLLLNSCIWLTFQSISLLPFICQTNLCSDNMSPLIYPVQRRKNCGNMLKMFYPRINGNVRFFGPEFQRIIILLIVVLWKLPICCC